MASVKIDNLSRLQANAITMLFEDDTLTDIINEKLEKMDIETINGFDTDYDSSSDPDNLVTIYSD